MGLNSQLALLRQVKMMTHRSPQMDDNGEFSVFISELYDIVDNFLQKKDPSLEAQRLADETSGELARSKELIGKIERSTIEGGAKSLDRILKIRRLIDKYYEYLFIKEK